MLFFPALQSCNQILTRNITRKCRTYGLSSHRIIMACKNWNKKKANIKFTLLWEKECIKFVIEVTMSFPFFVFIYLFPNQRHRNVSIIEYLFVWETVWWKKSFFFMYICCAKYRWMEANKLQCDTMFAFDFVRGGHFSMCVALVSFFFFFNAILQTIFDICSMFDCSYYTCDISQNGKKGTKKHGKSDVIFAYGKK